MEKKIFRKKLLAILMILSLVATDFFVLSSNLVTYATEQISATSNSNIKFSVYFENGENTIQSSIKNEKLKLYAEINVNSEDGYLVEGTTIEIADSNFNIISSNKGIVEENVITLNQKIDKDNPAKIELGINPKISDKTTVDFLSKVSTVNLNGKYKYSQNEDGEVITASKTVCVNYQPDETVVAELETEIITNKKLSVDGTNKRIVQLLIKSRLNGNQYPIEYTKLNVPIPQFTQITQNDISVISLGKLGTNGKKQISQGDYTVDGQNLVINLSNQQSENDLVNWSKDEYDELVVTFIYPEDVDVSTSKITTNSEIKLYNLETLETPKTDIIGNTELNQVIIGKTEITTEELYKGQLYANLTAKENVQYKTQTTLGITNTKVTDQIIIHEDPDAFGTEGNEIKVNTKYVSTEINKAKMLEILGDNANIQIKNGNTIIDTITKDKTANDAGNIVITYTSDYSELDIVITGEPEKIGTLEINHIKEITGNQSYGRADLQQIKTLNAKNTTSASLLGTQILSNTAEPGVLELKETISKAELIIENDKTSLSTLNSNEVILGIKLITDGVQYDLYKEPTITIQMPEAVENVEFNTDIQIQQGENKELTINSESGYNPTNKTITIKIDGEQTAYPEASVTQAYIQLNLNITLSQFAITTTDEITMTYTNKNATQYYNEGIVKQKIEISGPNKLVNLFNLSSNRDTSLTETITQHITSSNAGKNIELEMTLINDTGSDMKNVKVLGKLPTTLNTISEEDGENTLETTLQKINEIPNATIYYTEVANATTDISVDENEWTTDLKSLSNAKLYLINLDVLSKGNSCSTTITLKVPDTIPENAASYTTYQVIYDTDTEANKTAYSRKIGLITSLVAGLDLNVTAQVGQNILKEGDVVKEGEIINYTVTIENKTEKSLEGVQLKAKVPDGTVLVEHTELGNYEEKTDVIEIVETFSLEKSYQHTKQYEVRVKSDSASSNSEILNQAIIIYENSVKTKELTNKLEEADIRVTMLGGSSEENTIIAGAKMSYDVCVENLSDKTIQGLKMQILSENNFNIIKITSNNMTLIGEEIPTTISIGDIPANDEVNFSIYGEVKEDITQLNITAIIEDTNKEQYRSNLLTHKALIADATITLLSLQNNSNIKEGDKVTYNITVENTGEIETTVTVKDIIPEYLKIKKITIGNEIYRQTENENEANYIKSINNEVNCYVSLEVGQKENIIIETEVMNIPDEDVDKVITNVAEVVLLGISKDTSETIKHTLKVNKVSVDDIKNRISGFVWLDSNANGEKDNNETCLEGTIVKIYDITGKCYLAGEDGTIISAITDVNGEYTFTKIPNGSYIVVLESNLKDDLEVTINSKAEIHEIIINEEAIKVIGIKIENLQDNTDNLNIGLKEKNITGEGNEDDGNGDNGNGDNGNNGGQEVGKQISGFAWIDVDRDGQKDDDETSLSGIKVRLYDVSTKNYLLDNNKNIIETTTDNNGQYTFENIEKGLYVVLFEYNIEEYEPTIYLANGVDTAKNSKVVLKKLNINGEEKTYAVTDTINLQDDISNINIGLKEKLIFDLELNKYINRIVVQNDKGTKSYEYKNKAFAKVEIHKKQLEKSLVVLEYTIKVKNNGEISGYVKNIVDYLPSGLTFSSELNTDWYLSENYLYTKSLENTELKPGEEKVVKLILTKTMTSENTGLINNRAEIYQDYNKYGDADIDSTPNNQVHTEDDMSSVDVIIGISTGGSAIAYLILLIINIILIGVAIKLMIKNDIIKIPTIEERR